MSSTPAANDPSPAPRTVLAVHGTGLVDPRTPVLRADDPGVTRGDGCFEGIHVAGGRARLLDEHLDRMAGSAQALQIVLDLDAVRAVVADAVGAWPVDAEGALKVVLTRGPADTGPQLFATLTELTESVLRTRRDGTRVATLSRGFGADAFAGRPWLLGGVKTLSYAVNMAADREAQARDCDDVVFVDTDSGVLEAPTSSVVVEDADGVLRTVEPGDNGILASVTTRALLAAAADAGRPTATGALTLADLHAAPAAWLVSAVRGPVEIVELDGQARPRDPDRHARVRALAGFAD